MSASALPPSAVAVIDGVDVDVVAAAVRACPAVDDLHPGPGGIATYLPGRRIDGVRVDPHTLAVAIRARWGVPATEVAAQIRHALAVAAAGRRVDVTIADLADPAASPEIPARPLVGTATTASEQDPWTTNSSGAGRGGSSSGPIIQTGAATPLSSSPA